MEFRDCENQKGAYLNNTCIMMGSPAWEEVIFNQNFFSSLSQIKGLSQHNPLVRLAHGRRRAVHLHQDGQQVHHQPWSQPEHQQALLPPARHEADLLRALLLQRGAAQVVQPLRGGRAALVDVPLPWHHLAGQLLVPLQGDQDEQQGGLLHRHLLLRHHLHPPGESYYTGGG